MVAADNLLQFNIFGEYVVVCVLKVFALDISKQLEAYEVEYHVLQEEMSAVRGWRGRSHLDACLPNDTSDHLARLQVENEALHRQKTELLDQLQVSPSMIIIDSVKITHSIPNIIFRIITRKVRNR